MNGGLSTVIGSAVVGVIVGIDVGAGAGAGAGVSVFGGGLSFGLDVGSNAGAGPGVVVGPGVAQPITMATSNVKVMAVQKSFNCVISYSSFGRVWM